MFLKICGITRLADATLAVEQGATALGFVFWPRSPRYVSLAQAADIVARVGKDVSTVGVFVNETVDGIRRAVAETGITMVQLHGNETPTYAYELASAVRLLRAVTLDTAGEAGLAWPSATTLLLDAEDPQRRGGTGKTIDWPRAAGVARVRRVVLAGGLTPENVADAVQQVRPFGVDVSSGVEEAPGVKDADKVTRFLANARRAYASIPYAEVLK